MGNYNKFVFVEHYGSTQNYSPFQISFFIVPNKGENVFQIEFIETAIQAMKTINLI